MTGLYETSRKYARLGYVCIPVSVSAVDGKKRVSFPDEYKAKVFDQPEDWDGFTGIAVNTALSGIVVVDIDKGPGKDGWAGLAKAGITLPDTPMKAWTQSGGEHWFYRATSVPVVQSASLLADDVDIRGDASGVVFAYPTEVSGGGSYTWQDYVIPVGSLPEFPVELAQRLADMKPKRALPRPPATPPDQVSQPQRDRLLKVVDQKLEVLRTAPPGRRFEATSVVMRIVGIGKALGETDELADRIRDVFPGDEEQVESAIRRAVLNAEPEVLPEDEVRGFWDMRPELTYIREAAHAATASPFAVLGAVLVRVLAGIPPGWVLDTKIGAAGGNLNTFAVLAAESGGGKGIATEVAEHLWPYPAESGVFITDTASGEGLARLFANREGQTHSSVIVDVDEYASLRATADRSGSTLATKLSTAWSGKGLSMVYSDEARNISVPGGSYRLGMIAGLQYGNAKMLLSAGDQVQGFPQRFVWFPAELDYEPDPYGEDSFPKPIAPTILGNASHRRISVSRSVAALIRSARRGIPGLDGHKLYARVKLAYGLAVLNGHIDSVRDEDWELAGVVMDVSDRTRQKAQEAMRSRGAKEARSRGQADGIRQAAADDVVHEHAVQRVAKLIQRHREENPGITNGALRRKMAYRDKATFDELVPKPTGEGS